VLAGFVAQVSTAGPSSSGGAVVVAGDVGGHLGWMADIAFQRGDRTVALGRVTVDNASGLAAFLARASWGRTTVRAGLGLRSGGAWLSGTPVDFTTVGGGAVNGAWWGPLALVDGSVTLGGRVVLELTFEGGRVLLPVVATIPGAAPVAIDGNWIRGALGVGFTM
jgi:hypothetical protein